MRAAVALACLVVPVIAASATAQVKAFPYRAVVATEGTPVYSGPGQKYYATGRLPRGETVTVHRHDPGGWSMIGPPADGFSLVKADEVRPAGSGAVEVVAEEVSVRVGSRNDPQAREVEQVRVSKGDRLEVAAGIAAPAGWVAVRPPRGEYRWVAGRYLVAADATARANHDADPFAVPSIAQRPEAVPPTRVAESSDFAEVEKATTADAGQPLTLGPPTPVVSGSETFRRLRELDGQLEALDGIEPTEWPLDPLAVEYQRIKRTAEGGYGRQIDLRLAQLERLRVVKAHYSDYIRLASGTDERDAMLTARQGGTIPAGPAQMAFAPRPEPTIAGPAPMPGPPGPQFAMRDAPGRPMQPPAAPPADALPGATVPRTAPLPMTHNEPPVAPQSGPNGNSAAGPSPAVPGQPQRFDAVGIVQKAVDPHPDAPQYVLTAPNGRILVYLQSQPGVPLDKFVGQPMGIDGQTHRHPEVKTPMIVVDRLTPVRF